MPETAIAGAFRFLKKRITAFTQLPLGELDQFALGHHLREIGRMDGATHRMKQV